MSKIPALAIIPLLVSSPMIFAEPFSHNNAQVTYRAEHWAISGERAITEDFYVTGFFHHTDDIASEPELRAKAKILGTGLMTSTRFDYMTELYAGAHLNQSSIEISKNGAKSSDSNFYPSVMAGIKISSTPDLELDFNVSHYFSDSDVKYDYLDSTSFALGGKYFIDQSMSLGLSYVWIKDQDKIISKDNLALTFSLYFE
ncbi:MAG: hypothetical protein ACI86X_001636 [Moritella sp.]|jgi:hypothetical protein